MSMPSWITFESKTNTLSGEAGWDHVCNSFDIKLVGIQGDKTIDLSCQLAVNSGEIIWEQGFGAPENSLYTLPYEVGKTYKFSQVNCSVNPVKGHHNWFAYDIDMDIGETVLASKAGEVIAVQKSNSDEGADCSGGKENFVFIRHGDGTVKSYAHFTTNGVIAEVGDWTDQGQAIALSGNSDCTAGPHTHVAWFRYRTNFDRQSTLPFKYSNAMGSLNANSALVLGEEYTAL